MDGSATPQAPTDPQADAVVVAAAEPIQDASQAPVREPTAEWPRIADYWPDKPGNQGEPADPGEPRVIAPPPPARRRRLRLAVAAVSAVIFLGVSAVVLTRLVNDPDPAPPAAAPAGQDQTGVAVPLPEPSPPVSIAPSPSGTPSPEASAAPTGGSLPFQSGTFDLVSDVSELNVTMGRPTDGVVDIRTGKGSGIDAKATVDGSTVRLKAEKNGKDGPARVDVVLDVRIAWKVRMSGGVSKAKFGLAGGNVRSVDLSGGAAIIDLALPRQLADIPIRMSGGVRTWRIRTEQKVPVRVKVRRGAGEVVLYGDREKGINRGETVRTGGHGDGRLEIEAVAGMGSLTVSSW
jgi:hypothetical protein